jgi:hypothetical protein
VCIPLGSKRLDQLIDFIADGRDSALADFHQFQPMHTGAGDELLHSAIVSMNIVLEEFSPTNTESAVLAIKEAGTQ